MHIPALISDLAIILLTAGIIAIVFKRIKQPLVLGYILAGFLVSPHFPWFSTISDGESIEIWSEIGIIFIMFHLGLEFNLLKKDDILWIMGSNKNVGAMIADYVDETEDQEDEQTEE